MSTKYKVISESIENDIKSGKYRETGKLPTEDELIRQYRVSRNTIRKAVDILVKRGIIMPIQGSGMFCARRPPTVASTWRFSTASPPVSAIARWKRRWWISNCWKPMPSWRRLWNVRWERPFTMVQRLRLVDGKRFVVEYSYFNKDVIPYLSVEIARGSIYRYITEDLKKQIGYVDRVIEAGRLQQARRRTAGPGGGRSRSDIHQQGHAQKRRHLRLLHRHPQLQAHQVPQAFQLCLNKQGA